MILVHPDFRRRGIASAIMKKCIQTARQQMKCNIIGLDATITGQQVYTNLGFKPSFRLWRCLAATNDVMNQKLNLEIAPIPELAHCYRLLDDIGIGHRACWLALVQSLNPDHCWSAKFRGEIVGLIISRPGRLKPFIGPLVAKSPDIARDLLYLVLAHWKHQGFEEVFIDIPEVHFKQASVWENEVNLALPSHCLLIQKLTISRPLVRMYQISPDHGSKVAETDKNDEGIDVPNMLETKPDATVVDQTIQYMVNEKASLKYLFATGGPELS
jgi:hypothetical protein